MPSFFSGTVADVLPLAGGLLSGLMGGNKRSPEEERLLRIQMDAANRLRQYGTGIPGSAPDEMAALAQNRALLGEQQAGQRQQLLASLSPHQGMGSLPDFLQNLSSAQTAQQMSLSSTHLMDALAQRRQALLQASGTAQGAAGLAGQRGQPSQLPALFGSLAQQLAYKRAMEQGQQAGQGQGLGVPGAGAGAGGPALTMPGFAGVGLMSPPSPLGAPGSFFNQAQGLGTMVAPGNQPGGLNSVNNQNRQGFGLAPQGYGLQEQIRRSVLG